MFRPDPFRSLRGQWWFLRAVGAVLRVLAAAGSFTAALAYTGSGPMPVVAAGVGTAVAVLASIAAEFVHAAGSESYHDEAVAPVVTRTVGVVTLFAGLGVLAGGDGSVAAVIGGCFVVAGAGSLVVSWWLGWRDRGRLRRRHEDREAGRLFLAGKSVAGTSTAGSDAPSGEAWTAVGIDTAAGTVPADIAAVLGRGENPRLRWYGIDGHSEVQLASYEYDAVGYDDQETLRWTVGVYALRSPHPATVVRDRLLEPPASLRSALPSALTEAPDMHLYSADPAAPRLADLLTTDVVALLRVARRFSLEIIDDRLWLVAAGRLDLAAGRALHGFQRFHALLAPFLAASGRPALEQGVGHRVR